MVTRIRYTNLGEGKFINKTPLIGGGDLLTVEIEGLTFRLLTSTGRILCESIGKNNINLKKNIKIALKAFGVNFSDEVRKK